MKYINIYQCRYSLSGVHGDLVQCMNRVFVRGCEAAYLGDLIGKCDAKDFNTDQYQDIAPLPNDRSFVCKDSVWHTCNSTGHLYPVPVIPSGQNEISSENLVVHIRSGDIFDPMERHWIKFGQVCAVTYRFT